MQVPIFSKVDFCAFGAPFIEQVCDVPNKDIIPAVLSDAGRR